LQIENLKLRDFRNYKSLNIDFAKAFNIIYGNNAQGKTNIIEAIFLCASGRSHRTSKDIELLRNDAAGFGVKLLLGKEGIQEEIEIAYTPEEKKKIRINEIPVRKIGDLMGHLNAVIFSPEDLLVIKQGPAERRRFADITLSQLKPSYFYDLQQYAKIMYQRNTLLKNIIVKRELEATLDVWDKHLTRTGSRIIYSRSSFIKKLDKFAAERHAKLTNKEEVLTLKYDPSFEIDENLSTQEIEEVFTRALEKSRTREIQKGSSMYGPHRDDIDIILNGESTKIYGSQGQQRTSVLSMKLAEIDLMKEETGDLPVLLLDDVLSELDDRRKEYLLENINDLQTFITCTDKRFFQRSTENAAVFYVENGNIANDIYLR
jgi:DNA replication and repair protein RecF